MDSCRPYPWGRFESGLACNVRFPCEMTTSTLTQLFCGKIGRPRKKAANNSVTIVNVTSFSSISYCSNSVYWTQSESIYFTILDVHVLKLLRHSRHLNKHFNSLSFHLHLGNKSSRPNSRPGILSLIHYINGRHT